MARTEVRRFVEQILFLVEKFSIDKVSVEKFSVEKLSVDNFSVDNFSVDKFFSLNSVFSLNFCF